MASSLSSSKIHLFKKSAIEAGTPEDYYLNPSDNLWKMVSEWRVVEHEDVLAVTIHMYGFGNGFLIEVKEKFINFEITQENKEKAAGFEHKDGMKKFSIEMNPKFLNLGVKDDPTLRMSDGTVRLFISKLKLKK